MDTRMRERIGGSKRYRSAAFRTQHHDAASERVVNAAWNGGR